MAEQEGRDEDVLESDSIVRTGSDNQSRLVAEQSAFSGATRAVTLAPVNAMDLLVAMSSLEEQMINVLNEDLAAHKGIKWFIAVTIRYSRLNAESETIYTEALFATDVYIAVNSADVSDQLPQAMQVLHRKCVEFEANGSGWIIDEIQKFTVNTSAYTPLMGSSFIKLPRNIEMRRAVLNIKNRDNKCILWAILAHLHPIRSNPNNWSNYHRYEHELNMAGVSYPTPLQDITKIEQNNNISINVFGYNANDTCSIYPLYRSKVGTGNHINLLLAQDGEKRHYCLIRNFSRLMAYRTRSHCKQYFCFNCLHSYCSASLRDAHIELCYRQKTQTITFPEKPETVKFTNVQKQLPVPFVIYADFECYTQKLDTTDDGSQSKAYQKHQPSGFCYMVVSSDSRYTDAPVLYRGDNVIDKFFERLTQEESRIQEMLSKPEPMKLSAEEIQEFLKSNDCHICGKSLGTDRVRDHDHLSGKFRGAAHSNCNLNYKYAKLSERIPNSYIIPVVFHNLRGYDGHLLMASLGKYKNRRIRCIANNSERYVSFSLGCLRFIDSCQFLLSPLDTLVANLAAQGEDHFKHIRANYTDPQQRSLLLRKGVYPYDYVDGPSKLTETRLPAREEFYSILNQEQISESDYEHAELVWNTFKCQTLGDYHDLYLESDTLLLADVFESFRSQSITDYLLDPAHYYTAPGLSWDSMLKYTGIELRILRDPDMYLMIESGIRGGVSMITKKHAVANNPYLESYDPAKPHRFLMYLDANNLYGWAMSQKMPVDDFKWLGEEEIRELDVMTIADDSNEGYILEVDLEYPDTLHDLHSDLPVGPDRKTITYDRMSPYTRHLHSRLNVKGRPQEKLIPNLDNKSKYVIHYINLKQYLHMGLKLTHIHRAITFSQSFWLRRYISLNTEKRKQATNSFQKDFYKLMNNSIFGKTMENVRSRVDIELVHKAKRLKKIVAKPKFHRVSIFNEDLAAVQCMKTEIELNKPIYVGFAILDVSKTLMYDFHYEYIKHKYGAKAQLCFTDTDSLLYDIQTEDVYTDMAGDSDLYDTSNYPDGHALHSTTNKKVIGKMKDEMGGSPIEEFVGLRSKMYSIKCGGIEKKVAKGIKRATIKHELRHAMYRDVLLEEQVSRSTVRMIRSKKHELFSVVTNKLGLSPYDDKRFVLDDKVTTLPYGHFSTHPQN